MIKCRLPIIFFLLISALYVNSISGAFLIDDTFLVRDNPFIENFSNFTSYFTSWHRNLWQTGSSSLLLFRYCSLWQKHRWLSYLKHHYTTLFILYPCLLFLPSSFLVIKLFRFIYHSYFIAHPLHTEGVAYISGRKDVLGGLLSFASLICFIEYLKNRKRTYSLLAFLFFLLAINAKKTYAILPVLFLAVGYYQGEQLKKHKTLLGGLAIVALSIRAICCFFQEQDIFRLPPCPPGLGQQPRSKFPYCHKDFGLVPLFSILPFSLARIIRMMPVKRITMMDFHFLISLSVILLCALAAYYFRQTEEEKFLLVFCGCRYVFSRSARLYLILKLYQNDPLFSFPLASASLLEALSAMLPKKYAR